MTDEDIKHPADGNAENTVTGTIFDDVFRTIAEKLPFLLIALINEVFHVPAGPPRGTLVPWGEEEQGSGRMSDACG